MTEILTDIAIKWRRLKLKFQRNLGELMLNYLLFTSEDAY